jgi:SnoaL-like domain
MAVHIEITPSEAADRLAIRELFDAYAHCADRRDAEGQKALFTTDTRFSVYMDGEGSEPTYALEGREALTLVRRSESLRGNDAFQRAEHCHDRWRPRSARATRLPTTTQNTASGRS